MTLAERLADRMNAAGLSQSELARRVGVAQQTIHKLLTGASRSSAQLHRIARELGTTAEYLSAETDDPGIGAVPAPTPQLIAEQLDLVAIQQIDLAYGMGASFADGHVEVDLLHFPKLWIEAITSSPPALLTWARGRGDSMAPTIFDGDLVLLDRSQRKVMEQDAIWAFTVGEIGAIKRLRRQGDRMVIMSDNQNVSSYEEQVREVNIVARVTAIVRRI